MTKEKLIDCPVCGTEMVVRGNPTIQEVTRCPNCGHVYVDYPGDANEFHQHAYRVSTKHGRRGSKNEFDESFRFNEKFHLDRSEICSKRIKCLQDNLDLSECSSMLDIGAGGGTFARWARAKLNMKSIECQEISEICIKNLRMDGFPTYTGDFNSINWNGSDDNPGFDLVTCWHTLEHINDIKLFAEQVSKITNKYLVIEVPLDERPNMGPVKTPSLNGWDGHHHFFTYESMALLFKGKFKSCIRTSKKGIQPPSLQVVLEK